MPVDTRFRKREPTINDTFIAYAWEVNEEDKTNNVKRPKKEFTFDVTLDEGRDEGTGVANAMGNKRKEPAKTHEEDDVSHWEASERIGEMEKAKSRRIKMAKMGT